VGPHRRRGMEKKDKDTEYVEGNLDSQFQQEIRQCLGLTLSETLKMTRMNGVTTISSTAFLRV
jgi:aspartate/tyrosine/aromatic aminotransferase